MSARTIARAVLAVSSLVVTRCEGQHVPNLHPPTRLDIVFVPGQTLDVMRSKCDAMGGDDLTSPDGVWFTCEGVDY